MRVGWILLFAVLPCAAQQPRVPDVEAQRAAMKKLAFLEGKWAGEARLFRGPGEPIVLAQAEDAQYKLGGLVMVVEGIGRREADGKAVLEALAIVSYDDENGTYRMRAFNDGRFLETEVKLTEDGKGITWGFSAGQIRTRSVMRINDRGEWTEVGELALGSRAPQKFLELAVKPQR